MKIRNFAALALALFALLIADVSVAGTKQQGPVSGTGQVRGSGGGGISTPVSIANGGTAATTEAQAVANLSNAPHLPGFEAKFQSMRENLNRVRILVVSDSTGVGGVAPDVGWPYQLANAFTNHGLPASADYASAGTAAVDTQRVVIGSSWTVDGTITTAGGNTYKATTSTNGWVFTPQQTVTHGRLWYVQQPGGGTISIDMIVNGATIATANVSTAGTAALASLDVTSGGTAFNGASFSVKWVSGGRVNLQGVEAWNGNSISIINTSLGGSAISGWSDTSTGYAWLNSVLAMAPDLVIVAPGINSMPGTSLSTYRTQIDTFLNAMKAASIDTIVLTPFPQNPTDGTHNNSVATQDGYVGVNVAAAAAAGYPLINFYTNFVSYAVSSNINGVNRYIDTWTHPNGNGYSLAAGLVYNFLMSNAGPITQTNDHVVRFQRVNAFEHYQIQGAANLSRAGTNSVVVGVSNATGTASTSSVYVGDGAGALASTGQNQTVVGKGALAASQAGKLNNTAIGFESLKASTGNNNTALGLQSGLTVTSGSNNTCIGQKVCSTVLTTGSNNLLLGFDNAVTVPTAVTNLYFNAGNLLSGDMTNRVATSTGIAEGQSAAYFTLVSSGVNSLRLTNAATGSGPILSAQGTDTNIDLNINPKGTGGVKIGASTGAFAIDASASTNAIKLPIGTTAQRPTGAQGMVRYNSTTGAGLPEYYDGSAWQSVPSVASGSGSVRTISFQPGLVTSVTNTKGVYRKVGKAATVGNIVGSAVLFTCSVNPVVTLYECGTSATCASPTTIGSVTITAAGQAFDGTVSAGAVAAGDYIGWAISAGTCTSLDLAATAELTVN